MNHQRNLISPNASSFGKLWLAFQERKKIKSDFKYYPTLPEIIPYSKWHKKIRACIYIKAFRAKLRMQILKKQFLTGSALGDGTFSFNPLISIVIPFRPNRCYVLSWLYLQLFCWLFQFQDVISCHLVYIKWKLHFKFDIDLYAAVYQLSLNTKNNTWLFMYPPKHHWRKQRIILALLISSCFVLLPKGQNNQIRQKLSHVYRCVHYYRKFAVAAILHHILEIKLYLIFNSGCCVAESLLKAKQPQPILPLILFVGWVFSRNLWWEFPKKVQKT